MYVCVCASVHVERGRERQRSLNIGLVRNDSYSRWTGKGLASLTACHPLVLTGSTDKIMAIHVVLT